MNGPSSRQGLPLPGSSREAPKPRPATTPPAQLEPVEAAYAAALAALPGVGPASLAAIIDGRSPAKAWADVRAGRIVRPAPRARAGPDPRRSSHTDAGAGGGGNGEQAALFDAAGGPAAQARSTRSWAEFAHRLDPLEWWRPYEGAGVRVTWRGGPHYPTALIDDPEPPGVLFWRGRLECLDSLCVAIVGTRNATPDGRATAFELARDLAEAGVCVVSGLALGIDGAAHAGALAAFRAGALGRTVGIAASGVDVPYPRRHSSLWRDVVGSGAILSETPPGRPAQAWRFPSRNRVIAGLASMVVVVESHTCGGSLITAEAAIERGVEVRVVPGPVHSPASAGSNQLLYDGPGPVRNARDVLDALGVLRPDRPPAGLKRSSGRPVQPGSDRRPPESDRRSPGPDRLAGLDGPARLVLDAIGWRPSSTGQIMARTGLDATSTGVALDALVAAGCVAAEGGWWVRMAQM